MPFLKLETAGFIAALKRISPRRMTVAARAGELYIGKADDEVVFCLKGAMTRCLLAEGDWDGFAVVTFGMVTSFLKAPPTVETLTLTYNAERLKIDTLSLRSIWVAAPPWLASMATEAHLQDVQVTPKITRYCPHCGKRKGEPVELTARNWPDGLPATTRLLPGHANMRCRQCGYAWSEIGYAFD